MRTNASSKPDRNFDGEATGREIVHRPGIGSTATVRHQRRLKIRNVWLGQPTLLLVLRGRKRVSVGGQKAEVGTGGVVALPGGTRIDLDNDPDGGVAYEALSVMFDQTSSTPAGGRGAGRPIGSFAAIALPPQGFRDAIESARTALLDWTSTPEIVARHRLDEPMLWLRELGWIFPQRSTIPVSERLRVLVQAALEGDSSGCSAAPALGMSRATLDRRLAAEGETLAGVVRETRLLSAMHMLQATDERVTAVSLSCGLGTPSSFARQFRGRDLPP